MTHPRLLVLGDTEGRIEAAPATGRLRELADVRFLHEPLDAAPSSELADVRVLLTVRERTRLDADTLARLPALELIVQTGGHAYHVDAGEAQNRGIIVALGRRATTPRAAVPELTFALMIGALRMMPRAVREMSDGGWPALMGRCLAGRRLGLLGIGRHGARVARIAQAFGMEVVAWRRAERDEATSGIARRDMEWLLRNCDVLSIHLRLSQDSRGLLGHRELALCKPGAVLVNTARGAIVDEAALVDALRDGPLAAAGLDVFTEEPLPADSPLRTLPNVVLTPHIGWTVEEVFDEFVQIATEQLENYLQGTLDPAELLDPTAAQVTRSRCGGVAGLP